LAEAVVLSGQETVAELLAVAVAVTETILTTGAGGAFFSLSVKLKKIGFLPTTADSAIPYFIGKTGSQFWLTSSRAETVVPNG
jgi:hypothetical protein